MTLARLRLVLFLIVAIVQLAVAGAAIFKSELALQAGEVFKFRVQPVEAKGWRIGVLAFTNRSNAPQRDDAPTLPFLSAREVATTVAPVMAAARVGVHDGSA